MKIEEAIKQSKFNHAYHKVMVNLLYTTAFLKELQTNVFKAKGLLLQHYNALRIIKGRYPASISPGEIKQVMLEKSNDITRLLDKLVAMELITRNLCPENRRKMDVTITNKGIELLKELEKPIEELTDFMRKNITEKEAEQLSNLLDKIRG
jgi:DNA-binding MarR family transcriptional regulator